jgi:ubiquinone/menaquinone biosynthesis C-methylase UbiE
MPLHQGDATTLPVADDSLDAVVAAHTIYFCAEPAVPRTDIARALCPAGPIVVSNRDARSPRRQHIQVLYSGTSSAVAAPVTFVVAPEWGDLVARPGMTCAPSRTS